ncbi:MAG: DnaJ C-terminal domain-containing protein [Acetobacteraceae bacterium]
MASDPYQTLGVSKTATADEIRSAFRKIAKKDHPDLNPGNTAAEERFKSANAANEILSDPERRARFDRGEIDGAGQQRPERAFYRDYAQADGGKRYAGGAGLDPDDLSELFGEFFEARGGGTGAGAGTRPRRGADRRYRMQVPFLSAINGATERLTLPSGETVDVRIPPGLEDGQSLRLRGKGGSGRHGGADGDALIEVEVLAHPAYRRQGADLELDLPVTLAEAALGGKVAVPTPRGEVTLTVPAQSEAGTRLRLRGRGVAEHGGRAAGDLFVTLRLVAGPVDAALEQALRDWAGRHPEFDPREAVRRQA